MLITLDSPLRRLPANLDRRQALFLDGIRHAAELSALSYERLCTELTELALLDVKPPSGKLLPRFTSAFLDAWAFVDSIDRMRSLLHLMPGLDVVGRAESSFSFREKTSGIRDLRNVADHLAQRVDYVIANNSAALGYLTWFTFLDETCSRGVACAIVPGTLNAGTAPIANPAGKQVSVPTGIIQLSAGEYTADLSAVMVSAAELVRELEASLESAVGDTFQECELASGSDLIIKVMMNFGSGGKSPHSIDATPHAVGPNEVNQD